MRFRGTLYRAIDPRYAAQPLSGEGARRRGGRFNPPGVPVLYTSLCPRTATREALSTAEHLAAHRRAPRRSPSAAGRPRPARAPVLATWDADVENVFDATSASAVAARGVDPALPAAPGWRDGVPSGRTPATQAFASSLMADGFAGLLVRSFARGSTAGDLNLVLFRWSDLPAVRPGPVADVREFGLPG